MNTTAAPATALKLRAFNTPVGAVIRHADLPAAAEFGGREGEWVVVQATRDDNREIVTVHVVLHDGRCNSPIFEVIFLDYCAEVTIVGFSANPLENEDLDFGV